MKALILSFSLFILILIITGCEHDKEANNQVNINGSLVNHSNCKSLITVTGYLEIHDTLSCVEYSFNASDNKLLLKHINAGFNCCPDSLYSNISVSNDTIIVREYEYLQNCYCNCLYDLDFEIYRVNSQHYVIRFIEPYCNDQEEIIFGVDLENVPVGSYCVSRFLNPWGI